MKAIRLDRGDWDDPTPCKVGKEVARIAKACPNIEVLSLVEVVWGDLSDLREAISTDSLLLTTSDSTLSRNKDLTACLLPVSRSQNALVREHGTPSPILSANDSSPSPAPHPVRFRVRAGDSRIVLHPSNLA